MFIQCLFKVVQNLKTTVYSAIESYLKVYSPQNRYSLTAILAEQCDCSFLLKFMISVKDETSGGLSNKGKEKVQE